MDLESIFCVDSDFDSLEMGGFGEISRIVPRGGDATRFSDDVPVAWGRATASWTALSVAVGAPCADPQTPIFGDV